MDICSPNSDSDDSLPPPSPDLLYKRNMEREERNRLNLELKEDPRWNLATYSLRRAIENTCVREEVWIRTIVVSRCRVHRYIRKAGIDFPKLFPGPEEYQDEDSDKNMDRWNRIKFEIPRNSDGEFIMCSEDERLRYRSLMQGVREDLLEEMSWFY